MRNFIKNVILKKMLICLITIIMVSNFIMPNYVCAAQNAGEQLVSGFFYLIAYVGDAVIKIMQDIMLGNSDIGSDDTSFHISYSPGMIFANQVPALDINFIEPMDSKSKLNYKAAHLHTVSKDDEEGKQMINDIISRMEPEGEIQKITDWKINGGGPYDVKKNILRDRGYYSDNSYVIGYYMQGDKKIEFSTMDKVVNWVANLGFVAENDGKSGDTADLWINEGKAYYFVMAWNQDTLAYHIRYNFYSTTLTEEEQEIINKWKETEKKPITDNNNDELVSVAANLQSSIATWYKALRQIALVGLLSVLVYIGIRIIISSGSAQDKAKYKSMLKDWVVAICILFILHYIMAFMLQFTDMLNNIIQNTIVIDDVGAYDELMSSVRNSFSSDFNNVWIDAPGRVIMYLALVILTVVFTIQYLKRVVFMAFLTMIAPMIALTYPIDKVKDGKAQAYSYWLKEYIFNCLIQPVHLLLYVILIKNAMEFATSNILYSIAALAFMVPAEKFIKEMFGMSSKSPAGTLGAAAGGALVMSMLNKIKAKPPKDEAGSGGGSPTGVRTANYKQGTQQGTIQNSAKTALQQPAQTSANQQSVQPIATQTPLQQAKQQSTTTQQTQNQNSIKAAQQQNSTYASGAGAPSYSRANGLNAIGKKYIYGADAIKSHGKKFRRGLGGAVLGAAAGTVAFATQVADGDLFDDPGKAFQETAVTAGIGYAAGANFSDSTWQKGKNVYETYREGAYGTEQYNNMKFDKQFFKSDAYRMITGDSSIDQTNIKARTQEFLNNGITDGTKIREALQNGLSGDIYRGFSDAGITKVDEMSRLVQAGIQPEVYEQYKDVGITDVKEIEKAKAKYPNMSDDVLAKTLKVAKDTKSKSLKQFKDQWRGIRFNGTMLDTDEALEFAYKRLVNFLD